MDLLGKAGTFIGIIAALWAAIIVLWLLKVSALGVARLIEHALLPLELRIYQWLQDRAMARTLGVPVGIVTARRRIETSGEPIDIPTAEGAKRHR